jgi:hypothetical protein
MKIEMIASATSASAVPPSPRVIVLRVTAMSVISSPHVTPKVVALAPGRMPGETVAAGDRDL